MDDNAIRSLAALLLMGCALSVLLGGLATQVGGVWLDRNRRVELRQTLFYVRGHARLDDGGLQIFRGYAVYGRVRLWRHDYGARHLQALGFEPHQTKLLEGEVTGLFRLHWERAHPQRLQGTFSGKRFAFAGKVLRTSEFLPAEPRAWQRPDASG